MKPYTKTTTIPGPSQRLIGAKQRLVSNLEDALTKEQTINRVLGGNVNQVNVNNRRVPEKLARFVRNVDASYKHHVNQEILQSLLDEAEADLARLQAMGPERRKTVVKTLNIIYRAGVIKPPRYPTARLANYHWEYRSRFQPWDRIGEYGQLEVRPEVTEGKVRLHYDEGVDHLISNVIDIGTVIKRQASSAKRQPYRFRRQDREFIARCRGVAGRILRLTEPRVRTTTMFNMDDARFSMRVFQDRVARLPEHLDMDVEDIVELCQHKLSVSRTQVDDDDYIKMIEFCEPTIHLNPAGLRRELKEIGSGRRVVLKLGERNDDSDSDVGSDQDTGRREMKSADSTDEEEEEEDDVPPLTRAELRKAGKRLARIHPNYGVNGNSASADIKSALKQVMREEAEQEEADRLQAEREAEQEEADRLQAE